MLRAFRRLVVIAILLAVVTSVAGQWGPGLAARSMSGYLAEVHAAEAGRYDEADRISAGITAQWESLRVHVAQAVRDLEQAVDGIAPGHGAG
jgi:hypothetical protein